MTSMCIALGEVEAGIGCKAQDQQAQRHSTYKALYDMVGIRSAEDLALLAFSSLRCDLRSQGRWGRRDHGKALYQPPNKQGGSSSVEQSDHARRQGMK